MSKPPQTTFHGADSYIRASTVVSPSKDKFTAHQRKIPRGNRLTVLTNLLKLSEITIEGDKAI